jgi:O-acetyl-ADP-ribose deacetylase (regulator of RNase III)
MLLIQFRDRNPSLVAEWRRQFNGREEVAASCGDVFDLTADAVVSPANSFGYMDGGIDLVYLNRFGWGLQDRLQAHLRAEHFGELPVGQATIVSTGDPEIPFLISAPTMRVPQPVDDTINVYLAFRAALVAVLKHNASGQRTIGSILVPGLGTGIGRVPFPKAAREMKLAHEAVIDRAVDRDKAGNRMWLGNVELLTFRSAP